MEMLRHAQPRPSGLRALGGFRSSRSTARPVSRLPVFMRSIATTIFSDAVCSADSVLASSLRSALASALAMSNRPRRCAVPRRASRINRRSSDERLLTSIRPSVSKRRGDGESENKPLSASRLIAVMAPLTSFWSSSALISTAKSSAAFAKVRAMASTTFRPIGLFGSTKPCVAAWVPTPLPLVVSNWKLIS